MYLVAITGGPGGGKSESMSTLSLNLEERGYKVIVVPEAATKLISSGIVPGKNVSMLEFQKFVLKEQLHNEKLAMMAAELYAGDYKNVVILCDRGLADQLAYIKKKEFEVLLKEEGLTINDIYARYDNVIHLVTAADGAEEFYVWAGSENTEGVNMARSETPEEACIKDKLTQAAWIGATHLKIVDNSTDFTEKKMRVLAEVFNGLGEPIPMEIERKFLIKMPTAEQLSSLGCVSKSNIIQTYLVETKKDIERRVRQRGTVEDGFSYYYTEKKPVGHGKREENENRISAKEYLELLSEADTTLHQISKTRHCFLYGKRYFELDVFPFSTEYAVLEIEVSDIDEQIELPPLDIIREVTDDNTYKNHHLALTMELKP